ncbi:M23 family metallopeptidase [Novosphingobium sp. HK4-1]|uniref:M23 family metallopeptidase n=2 Tax=Novosphingobium mangrovi (ex Huang et al. 2023) TaxID=2976432 RepID=A0ABT2I9U9_9SPHN|nr:M23 family metallopeptidase [Novosphingobium mangrovi (ex Huang et al. 2023)]MCT2401338.1 M23 family metallopeptidase [Novosphingobium mangrovi (ex Huang et al. 2023)]
MPGSSADAATPGPAAARVAFSGELTQGGWVRGTVPAGTRALSLDGQPVPVAADGSWFAAFDRDAGTRAMLAITAADGSVAQAQISVTPRAWKIEHVNIARRTGGPTEAFMKLRRPELAQIQAARARQTDAQGWREHFIWPVKGRISGRFGSQRVYRGEPGSYHSGIDITTGQSGTPFVAPADGVVTLVAGKPFTLEGNLLMIDHGMGLNSAFLHCSQILVKEGEHVKQGQVIGKIGMSGRATGPHLHWSIKWENARLDPLLFTGPMD